MRTGLSGFLGLSIFASIQLAHATGSIAGETRDAAGAVTPRVTLMAADRNDTRRVVTSHGADAHNRQFGTITSTVANLQQIQFIRNYAF